MLFVRFVSNNFDTQFSCHSHDVSRENNAVRRKFALFYKYFLQNALRIPSFLPHNGLYSKLIETKANFPGIKT